ncbi:MAG: homocysteine S-methyltransferase family protein [Butyricicoccus pullicaecorum]|nr:homocysteine S-methyltransferase family protein [Butyricicoccus pullicaecorum]
MGTMLQSAGLETGRAPEGLNLSNPELITKIHRAYLDAGAQILYTNTFGANREKLAHEGLSVQETIAAGVACAKQAVHTFCQDNPQAECPRVALDIGPIGQLLEPYGTLAFEDAYDIFREIILAGKDADIIVFETMTDLYEVKAAVLAAKENSDKPVFVTMTFEPNHRTFTGCSVDAMCAVLEGLGVDALGVNCSLGPEELYPIVQKMCELTTLPLIVKANAGLPDPETGIYSITPEQFAAQMARFVPLGVCYLGGCCGTRPDFIRQIIAETQGQIPEQREIHRRTVVCTPTETVVVDGVRVIGERINPTGKKRFQQALREGDLDYILAQAVEQADAGAHILDVNVGLPGVDEPEMMVRVVKAIQSVTDLPLQIDSSNSDALAAGLRVVNGKAIVNSVNGEPEVLERVLPIVKKYGAAVIGLTMDQNGIPATAEQRFAIAERILKAARAYGIPKEDVFIDCLTLTISAEQDKAVETLRAMEMVRDRLGLHCTLGVSNISFGLPNRTLITTSFLTLAMASGLDLPIVNPNTAAIMDTIRAFNVLYNRDRNAEAYIAAYTKETEPAVAPQADEEQTTLPRAVDKGLKDEARRLTVQLLAQGKTEMDIVNELLIPALDVVGGRFERGEIFLPQLINSAGAAQEAFEVIRTEMAQKGTVAVSKGTVIVATVKGDIHDIGKNIVKTIVENYGYRVIDLGRDVPIETVVQTAIRENVHLIGLSALMTTTLANMEETIHALRNSEHPCKIWVGGAVLTPEYAKKMGADFYARDARESVDICKEVLG